jgi:hypothetical protein
MAEKSVVATATTFKTKELRRLSRSISPLAPSSAALFQYLDAELRRHIPFFEKLGCCNCNNVENKGVAPSFTKHLAACAVVRSALSIFGRRRKTPSAK